MSRIISRNCKSETKFGTEPKYKGVDVDNRKYLIGVILEICFTFRQAYMEFLFTR